MTSDPVACVTGGAGYIGRGVVAKLLESGRKVLLLDNFSNSSPGNLNVLFSWMEKNSIPSNVLSVEPVDIRDADLVTELFAQHDVGEVVHLAALKSVSESINNPLDYFDINVGGTVSILRACLRHSIERLVFSSTASVYFNSGDRAVEETDELNPATPYGQSKLAAENAVIAAAQTSNTLNVAVLRYFNPVGASCDDWFGEPMLHKSENLMSSIINVAMGRRDYLEVYGDKYPTRDGTCLRDFIHLDDLSSAHIRVLDELAKQNGPLVFNLGTGKSVSVFELIETFQAANGIVIPTVVTSERQGDLPCVYASCRQVYLSTGWKAEKDLVDMCVSAWQSAVARDLE